MNDAVFGMTSVTYSKEQIETLAKLYERNGRIISRALSVALSMKMWEELLGDFRCVFIVECLERIEGVANGKIQAKGNTMEGWAAACVEAPNGKLTDGGRKTHE